MNLSRKTVVVVTVSRSDYGLLYWLLKDIQACPELCLRLVVSGTHLLREFGYTIDEIVSDGFEIEAKVEMPAASEGGLALAQSLAAGAIGMAEALSRIAPDIVVVLGDRAELWSTASACLSLGLPIAHFSGGESTEGAFDEQVRHAITKMAHVHFAAAEPYARRLIRMGEEPWRVHIVGDPGLEHFRRGKIATREELEHDLGIAIRPDTILLAYHPVTLELKDTARQIGGVLEALELLPNQVIATYPNGDPGSQIIIDALASFRARRVANMHLFQSLGRRRFLGMLRSVGALLGNSSAGLVEAASAALPAVNVGTRQDGRIRGRNVIDVGYAVADILSGIQKAREPSFRSSLVGISNPYGDGETASRVVNVLSTLPSRETLLRKKFHDVHDAAGIKNA